MGLTGEQGVLIPATNAGDLMLREDVVRACDSRQFHVYAVGHVTEAIEILTGMPAGELDEAGQYPDGSLLKLAQERASDFWRRTLIQPGPAENP
jgi:ATP-dependent Lon protease